MTTTIRLRGPADFITVLPYQLGYRPSDSLVLACLHGPRMGAIGRIDLPPPDVDPWLVVRELLPLVLHERPEAVLLIGFEGESSSSRPVIEAMADAVHATGYPVADKLVVRGDRWWSLDCPGSCCPPEGTLIADDADVPAVADYVVLGRRPALNRAALADRLRPVPDATRDSRCAALMQDLRTAQSSRNALYRRRRRMFGAWARILGGLDDPDGGTLSPLPGESDEAWAWAVVSLLDVPVRDLLIAWLCPGTLDLSVFLVSLQNLAMRTLPRFDERRTGDEVEDDSWGRREAGFATVDDSDSALLERLAMVCRFAPPELSAGPLTVLAHVAWWQGDGALARTALEQALCADPDYRLAALLEQMVDAVVRPRRTA